MRIGIITLPLHTNYGGILQAYALQTVLERMGHHVVILDRSPYKHLSWWKLPFAYGKRIIKKYVFKRKIRIIYEPWFNKMYPVVSQYTQPFIDKYLHRREANDLYQLQSRDFDVIVVGSDQIWRPLYYSHIEDAYLKFAEKWNIRRIAYAASFGTDKEEYSKEQIENCCKLIRKFDYVSVREDSGIELCQKYFQIEAKHLLDPTMLLFKDDYIQLIKQAGVVKSSGNLLVYLLDETEDKKLLVNRIAEEKKLLPFRVGSRVEDVNAPLEERIQPPVEQWLRGFYDAEFVITDSFHACVFSILFGKPFVVYGNKKRGMARFESLLRQFGLKNCLVLDSRDYKNVDVDKMYRQIEYILEDLRKQSYQYLEQALK